MVSSAGAAPASVEPAVGLHSLSGPAPGELPVWPLTALAVPIIARAALFASALLFEPWQADPGRMIPIWAQLLQAGCFASLAFVLLYFGGRDRRAQSLGLFVLDAAGNFTTPALQSIALPSVLTSAALHLRTDAFQAALLWYFFATFPRSAMNATLRRVFTALTVAAFVLGVLLVSLDAWARLSSGSTLPLSQVAANFQRYSPGDSDWYFTLQFFLLVPLFVLMPLKLRETGPDGRRRFGWLAAGIVFGFLPIAADTIAVTLWPGYSALPIRGLRAALMMSAVTLVPVTGAYAALVQRTLDVSLVVRRVLQYVLARSVIAMVAALPLVALVGLIVFNRDRPISDLVTGNLGLGLALIAAAGVAAAAGRRRLLAALDRHFFRQHVDARVTLLAVSDAVHRAESVETLREILCGAVESAFHPDSLVTIAAGGDQCLHAIDAELPALSSTCGLARLLSTTGAPLAIEPANGVLLDRLAESERGWLRAAQASLIVPLRASSGGLLGALVLGEKRSELPYSSEDRSLLAAVGAAGGVALERILTTAERDSKDAARWRGDAPARECVECGTIHPASEIHCQCGGMLQRAVVPQTLGDRLRFERRVGEGGMGIVFRAMDLRLRQARAVKTLPGSDQVRIARLRREARAMAIVTHPNLAMLHGLEEWRGTPLLVMEFLEGGTLAQRIRRPLDLPAVLSIGDAIASALAAVHSRGLLHRDVKPTNIGFSKDGTPKLLDFGLAKVYSSGVAGTNDESTWSMSISGEFGAVRGTPAYISPEVLAGAPPGPTDDVWSLSVTLLESATGANPFKAQNAAATISRILTDNGRAVDACAGLTPAARELFSGLLGPRDRRPKSVTEFRNRLTMRGT
jgi:tRNA A-37 threonylcarbamoyl transferase component Bud32